MEKSSSIAPINENIVVFPLMAQGHIIPFLALALKLEKQNGLSVTFVNTPQNIKKLKPSLPPNSSIRLREIPYDPVQHGFPEGCETVESLPIPLVIDFIEKSVCLKPAFASLLSDLRLENDGRLPVCVVSDMFLSWSVEVARGSGVPHAIFSTAGAYGLAMFHSITLNLPHLHSESDVFQVPGFPQGYTFSTSELTEPIKSGNHPLGFIWNVFEEWKKSNAILFNTAEDFDQVGLTYFKENFPNCRVIPIGPLTSSMGSKARAGENEAKTTWDICNNWLNQKPQNSVLYVAFGSQNCPSISQLEQLEMALEASQVSYIWVIKPPSNFASIEEKNEWMRKWSGSNSGEIVHKKNGLLLLKWAPQIEILSHSSIGAFMSHCGWNSTIEALTNGVPLLAWPLASDQPYNAKMLEEELKVSLKVANGVDDQVEYEELMKKIKVVMNEEKGDEMRKRALEIKEVIMKNNASLESVLDEFLSFVMLARKDLNP